MTTPPDEPQADLEPNDDVAHAEQSPEEISGPDSERFVDGDLEDDQPG